MNPREIEIRMTTPTVEALHGSGFRLLGFRVTRSSNSRARGLLLSAHERFSTYTRIPWGGELHAFTSFDPVEPGRTIRPGFSERIQPGQSLKIRDGALGTVEASGPAGGFGFLNQSSITLTVGLAEAREGLLSPFCAVPVLPGFSEVLRPTDKAVFIFSTGNLEPGTCLKSLFELLGESFRNPRRRGTSPGALVDLGALSEAALTYDLAPGWGPSANPAIRPVAPTADLGSLLIEKP